MSFQLFVRLVFLHLTLFNLNLMAQSLELNKKLVQDLIRLEVLNGWVKKPDHEIRAEFHDVQIIHTKRLGLKAMLLKDGDDDELSLVVRGTANASNVLLDFQFKKLDEEFTGISLHKGFSRAANEILHSVHDLCDRAGGIKITGHSMGGAIALVLAVKLHALGYPVRLISTYGQPRIGNHEAASYLNQLPLVRVHAKEDKVPHLPPKWISYRHGGNHLEFIGEKNFLYNPADSRSRNPEMDRQAMFLFSQRESKGGGFWGDAHQQDSYLRKLRYLLSQLN